MIANSPKQTSWPLRLAERLFGNWVRTVSAGTLRADVLAGLLGAVLVLPQGIAFATMAGLPPEYGLYTAVVPCIIAALFGSSWHVMSGPTNANSLALFAMLSPMALAFSPAYIQMALVVTVMVGVMQWLIGALRLGSLANFISPAALFGFTSGAAVLIAVHALPDLLGLTAPTQPGSAALLRHVASQLGAVQPVALAAAAVTLVVAVALRRWRPHWPYMLAGLAGATLAGTYLMPQVLPVETMQGLRTVGSIAVPWPKLVLPQVSWAQVPELLGLAFALTIVALGQAISIAKAVAARSGLALREMHSRRLPACSSCSARPKPMPREAPVRMYWWCFMTGMLGASPRMRKAEGGPTVAKMTAGRPERAGVGGIGLDWVCSRILWMNFLGS